MKRPLFLLTGLAAALMLLVSVVFAGAVQYMVIDEIDYGLQPDQGIWQFSVSRDSRYILTTTSDPDRFYLDDRKKGTRKDLTNSLPPFDIFEDAVISENGLYAAFAVTTGTYLNGNMFVYWMNLTTGAYESIAWGKDGEPLHNDPGGQVLSITPDGRYVLYHGGFSNPFDGQTVKCYDSPTYVLTCFSVFLYDRQTRKTERISVNSDEVPADDWGWNAAMSHDGRWVLFDSGATNLGCPPGYFCGLYLRDRLTGTTQPAIIGKDGKPPFNEIAWSWFGMSSDGRYISFSASDTSLFYGNLYLYDRNQKTVELISVSNNGVAAQELPYFSAMSADTRYILFSSKEANLLLDDPSLCPPENSCLEMLFMRDRVTKTTTLVSRTVDEWLQVYGNPPAYVNETADQVLFVSDVMGTQILISAPENTTLNRPKSIKASAGSNGNVYLSWTGTNNGIDAAEIDRSSDGLTGWVNVGAAPVGMTTFTDTTAPCKKSYYRVRAVDPVNNLVSPYSFTIKGKNDCRELLQNGGFEQPGETGKQAAFWNGKNLDDDLRVRNKNGIVVSYSGDAAFEFNGTPGVNSSISQTAAIPAGTGYNTLELSAWVMGENPTGVRIRATLYLADGTAQKLTLDTSAVTPEYTHLSTTLPYAASMQYAKVQIRQKDGTGKFRVDEVSLRLQTASAPLLPLPQ